MRSKRTDTKIAVLVGTRPEIIKMAPVIRRLRAERGFMLIHTGQHYSYEMDKVFFEELELPAPHHRLSVPSGISSPMDTIAHLSRGIAGILKKTRPSVLLVQGDTNSVLSGSLAAVKTPGVRLGHVEAGLRSYDRQMPEEINRVVADHVADFLFAPTEHSRKILIGEGIPKTKIWVTGNTIVDAVRQNLVLAQKKERTRPSSGLPKDPFLLVTLHRQENVDHPARLAAILKGIAAVSRAAGVGAFFPIHPRTRKRLGQFRLRVPSEIVLAEPVGFLDFLLLEKRARLILTDSGGVQEEGCILGVPCVTLRTTTERPETVSVGANRIAGFEPKKILSEAVRMMKARTAWRNPFGDGHAAERIVRILKERA